LYKISDGTEFVGKALIFLPKCHSTNDIAAKLFEKGLISAGTVVMTDHQIAGKGQRGNTWESSSGLNLTFSLVQVPDFLKPEQNFYLNIVTSLALTDVLLDLAEPFTIKWPNDLYYHQKKIGGILIENSILSGKISSSVIGIGLNVNQVHFTGLENAISLYQVFSRAFDLNEMLNLVVKSLDIRWVDLSTHKFESLKTDYLNRLYGYRQIIKFQINGQTTEGRIEGIDQVGRLMVGIDGEMKKFSFQEIKFLI
jgi:BirA family biotin operon repressor/biotin-[acetyl-CoA-carboxylase] ligase